MVTYNKKEGKNVLVIAPHIDDDILGCGGSIIKHIQKGNAVFTLYISSGFTNGEIKQREKEAKEIAKIIGIKEVFFIREMSRPIKYSKNLLYAIVKIMNKTLPDIIYAPHSGEGDYDHKTTSLIVSEAVWMHKEDIKHNISFVLYYEIWTPLSKFNYLEDVTNVMDKKINCIKFFRSQIKKREYNEAIKGLNRYRGKMFGNCEYAEAFYLENKCTGGII